MNTHLMECTGSCRVEEYRVSVVDGGPNVTHCPGCSEVGEPILGDDNES